jgi:hypothetical protein
VNKPAMRKTARPPAPLGAGRYRGLPILSGDNRDAAVGMVSVLSRTASCRGARVVVLGRAMPLNEAPRVDSRWVTVVRRSRTIDGDDTRPQAYDVASSGVSMTIDIAFDFRTDAGGKDPDTRSPTLRFYHRLLWSKQLPSGVSFDLSIRGVYLHHSSGVGEFFLSSDSVMQTFTLWPALKPITEQVPEWENEAFRTIDYTIGAMMVFPANQIDRKRTINQARGFCRSIADRFDLTLECIRRHYLHQVSPLAPTLSRYADFFALFGDFRGYVSFFLLEDLVTDDCSVKFFMPFDDFASPSVPKDVGT